MFGKILLTFRKEERTKQKTKFLDQKVPKCPNTKSNPSPSKNATKNSSTSEKNKSAPPNTSPSSPVKS